MGEHGFRKTHHIVMTNATSLSCRNTSCRSRLESVSLCASRGHGCRAIWFKQNLGGPQCGLCMCDTGPSMRSDITGVIPNLYTKSLSNLTFGMYQGQQMSSLVIQLNISTALRNICRIKRTHPVFPDFNANLKIAIWGTYISVICIFANIWVFCTEPAMRFPMDAAVAGGLNGHLSGHLKNGAIVIPGMEGDAFFGPGNGSGSHANFGTIEWLQFPDNHTSGITFSLWIKVFASPSSFSYILHTGGCIYSASGVCLAIRPDYIVFVSRPGVGGCNAKISPLQLFEWHFLTVSYKDCTISFYNNGCKLPLKSTSNWERSTELTTSYSFTIGGRDGSTSHSSRVAIDHMLIWDTELTSEDVWELYLLGGIL